MFDKPKRKEVFGQIKTMLETTPVFFHLNKLGETEEEVLDSLWGSFNDLFMRSKFPALAGSAQSILEEIQGTFIKESVLGLFKDNVVVLAICGKQHEPLWIYSDPPDNVIKPAVFSGWYMVAHPKDTGFGLMLENFHTATEHR